MSDARKRVIGEAFNKLDKSGDGFITIDDVRGVYDVKVCERFSEGCRTLVSLQFGVLKGIQKLFFNYLGI